MIKPPQEKRQQPGLSQNLADYEALIPCQDSLMTSRGYVRINGKWVAPENRTGELDGVRMRPRSTFTSNG